MRKTWVFIAIIILIVILGYLGRHKIRTLLSGSPAPVPVATTSAPSPTSAAALNNIAMTKTDPTKGIYATDPKGMTLYVFDKDQQGVSNCSGSCATIWPPYGTASAATSLPTNFTTLKRSDGSMQYAYKGMPLYFYQKDTKSGDILGDGVGAVWHLARP